MTCSALLCGWLREKGLFRRSGSCPARVFNRTSCLGMGFLAGLIVAGVIRKQW